jgi:hypothetical protein
LYTFIVRATLASVIRKVFRIDTNSGVHTRVVAAWDKGFTVFTVMHGQTGDRILETIASVIAHIISVGTLTVVHARSTGAWDVLFAVFSYVSGHTGFGVSGTLAKVVYNTASE